MNSNTKLLFIHNAPTNFVKLDLQILQTHYKVTEFYIRSWKQAPWSIWRSVQQADILFGWFASWHTFLPFLFARLLQRPAFLVIGGYDVANLPEIGYGHQRGGVKKWISRMTIQLATQLITNSHYSLEEIKLNLGKTRPDIAVIHHGVPDLFSDLLITSRRRMVLTVGNVDQANLHRKGHELFVQAAAFLPDVEFVLVGHWKDKAIDYLKSIAPVNVTFTGWVDQQEWLGYYTGASVYVQASAHEGFGMSVAEAMLAGCIPVVSCAGSLPEVIGDVGIQLDSRQPEDWANAILQALNFPAIERQRARQRVLNEFPLVKRSTTLCQLISTHLR